MQDQVQEAGMVPCTGIMDVWDEGESCSQSLLAMLEDLYIVMQIQVILSSVSYQGILSECVEKVCWWLDGSHQVEIDGSE